MSVIDTIQERLDKDLYTVSVFGSREAVYEQMWDDIESLLILFCAKNRAIEKMVIKLESSIGDTYEGRNIIKIIKNLQ